MVSDVRAATPTNAAQILVPDKQEIIRGARAQANSVGSLLTQAIDTYSRQTKENLNLAFGRIQEKLDDTVERLEMLRLGISQVNPENVLKRGYALLRGDQTVGAKLEIETATNILTTEVQDVRAK